MWDCHRTACDLVTAHKDKAEICNVSSVFTNNVSQASMISDRVQGREEQPAVDVDQVRSYWRDIDL